VALQALVDNGGTITHHHAVGDCIALLRPAASRVVRQGAAPAKRALDPKGMLNPGVLIDPER